MGEAESLLSRQRKHKHARESTDAELRANAISVHGPTNTHTVPDCDGNLRSGDEI